jgi:hypothetical protein
VSGDVHVRGTAFLSTKQFLVEHYGSDGFLRVIAALSHDDRELIEKRLQTSSWYSFDTWVALCEGADHVFGNGDLTLCRQMGRYGGLKDLGTAYRQMFTSGGDPLQIVRYAKQFWNLYYDSGRVEIDREAPGQFDVVVHIVSCRALGHPECRFRASWTMPPRPKTLPPR